MAGSLILIVKIIDEEDYEASEKTFNELIEMGYGTPLNYMMGGMMMRFNGDQ